MQVHGERASAGRREPRRDPRGRALERARVRVRLGVQPRRHQPADRGEPPLARVPGRRRPPRSALVLDRVDAPRRPLGQRGHPLAPTRRDRRRGDVPRHPARRLHALAAGALALPARHRRHRHRRRRRHGRQRAAQRRGRPRGVALAARGRGLGRRRLRVLLGLRPRRPRHARLRERPRAPVPAHAAHGRPRGALADDARARGSRRRPSGRRAPGGRPRRRHGVALPRRGRRGALAARLLALRLLPGRPPAHLRHRRRRQRDRDRPGGRRRDARAPRRGGRRHRRLRLRVGVRARRRGRGQLRERPAGPLPGRRGPRGRRRRPVARARPPGRPRGLRRPHRPPAPLPGRRRRVPTLHPGQRLALGLRPVTRAPGAGRARAGRGHRLGRDAPAGGAGAAARARRAVPHAGRRAADVDVDGGCRGAGRLRERAGRGAVVPAP